MSKRFARGKYVREIERLLPTGYSIGHHGHNDHPVVLRPDGRPLRHGDGRVVRISSTPSDPCVGRKIAADVRRALQA